MSKDFQEITLTMATPAVNLVGMPGILEVSGTPGTATLRISTTRDPVLSEIATNTAILAFPALTVGAGPTDNPIPNPEINATGIAFNVQASRLTFTALTPDGTTDITVRWYPVRTSF